MNAAVVNTTNVAAIVLGRALHSVANLEYKVIVNPRKATYSILIQQ